MRLRVFLTTSASALGVCLCIVVCVLVLMCMRRHARRCLYYLQGVRLNSALIAP
jgi:hypothetical protein